MAVPPFYAAAPLAALVRGGLMAAEARLGNRVEMFREMYANPDFRDAGAATRAAVGVLGAASMSLGTAVVTRGQQRVIDAATDRMTNAAQRYAESKLKAEEAENDYPPFEPLPYQGRAAGGPYRWGPVQRGYLRSIKPWRKTYGVNKYYHTKTRRTYYRRNRRRRIW